MLHISEFVRTLRSNSVWVVFNNFLLIETTDRSKISSNQKRFFIALSLYHLSFFANTPFKLSLKCNICPCMIFKLISHAFYKYESETLKFFSCFKIQARKGNTDEWVPQIVLRLKDDVQVCLKLSCLMEHTITRRWNRGAEFRKWWD